MDSFYNTGRQRGTKRKAPSPSTKGLLEKKNNTENAQKKKSVLRLQSKKSTKRRKITHSTLEEQHPNVPKKNTPARTKRTIILQDIIERQNKERSDLREQIKERSKKMSLDIRMSWAVIKLQHQSLCQPHAKFSDLMHFVDNHTSILLEWQRFLNMIREWEGHCRALAHKEIERQKGLSKVLLQKHSEELNDWGEANPTKSMKVADVDPLSFWKRPSWPEREVAEIVKVYESLAS